MAPVGVLRVVQLNAGTLLEPGWPERRYEALAWIDRLDADIVCLQEVWEDERSPNTAGWLVEQQAAGRWHWCFAGFPPPPELWPDPSLRVGSAVLSRWPIDEHELLELPPHPGPHTYPFDAVQMELLHARTNGIDVFSTHLVAPPRYGWLRTRQVLFLDEQVEARRDPQSHLPPIVCGDFNAEPDSDEIRFLCGNAVLDGRSTWYQEAWRAAGRTDPGVTQDARNPNYVPFNLPPKRIDYVFVGDCFLRQPAGTGLVRTADLAFHESLTGEIASDHFGLVVDVGWPERP